MRALIFALAALGATALVACAESGQPGDHDHEGEGDGDGLGVSTSALVGTDTVATAVDDPACSTSIVKALSIQLIEEIQCLKPNSMTKIDNIPKVQLGASAFPYLQTGAVTGLKAVVAARGTTMQVNSALRSLPQQYMLYRWYQQKRCNISLAAKPGTSNHESGLAVDVQDSVGWRSAFQNNKWRWLGSTDPVHYDFLGGGTVSLTGLSVLAFQRLWNRNHPEDLIAMDGDYGPTTEARIAKSPIGGLPQGAKCDADAGPTVPDAGAPAAVPVPVPVVPDGNEPGTEEPETFDEGGCAVRGGARGGPLSLAALGLALAFVHRRRKKL